MLLLQCIDIKKNFGINEVLKSVTLDLEEGERTGLVGKNGAGKTTLANIIAGNLKADEGEVRWHRKDVEIGYLRQSVFYTAELLHELCREQDVFNQAKEFLHLSSELGTEKVHQWADERFEALSGGERTKLALAHIWSAKPGLLILDEPTNHLDIQGVQWLIDELKGYPGTILVISHDRYFLDKTVNRILEIENGVIHEYKGSYTFYRNEKKKRYESRLHAYEVQKKQEEKLEQEIRRLKAWAGKAHRESTKKGAKSGNKMGTKEYFRVKAKKMDRQVKSAVKRLEKMRSEGAERPGEEPLISFEFSQKDAHGRRILEAYEIRKSFGEKVLFEESSFYLQRGERMGIYGPNGCGKTTLVRAVLGMEKVEGRLFVSPSIKIGYVSQDVLELKEEKRALDLFEVSGRKEQGRIRTMLANLGLNELLLHQPLKNLSMGERTKLKLANLLVSEYDMLILDEPTNHLDLYTREQLEDALQDYEGTILLVTHDRYMLEKICSKLLIFDERRIKRVEHGLEEYLKKQEHLNRAERAKGPQKTEKSLTPEEERMLLENRISAVLSRLSETEPGTPDYQALDEEFRELTAKRKSALL
jgi:macrolide transport system ATP-binding/permease protein